MSSTTFKLKITIKQENNIVEDRAYASSDRECKRIINVASAMGDVQDIQIYKYNKDKSKYEEYQLQDDGGVL